MNDFTYAEIEEIENLLKTRLGIMLFMVSDVEGVDVITIKAVKK